jgi:hypothetical protein
MIVLEFPFMSTVERNLKFYRPAIIANMPSCRHLGYGSALDKMMGM